MDAVKELAIAAGMDVPAPSPQAAQREAQVAGAADTLERAAAWYARQLQADARAGEALAARGITPASIDRFQLGFAPAKKGVAGCGASAEALAAAGLLTEDGRSGAWRDFFRTRLMIPVHDSRGRVVGFAGRIHGGSATGDSPKYINSPESDHFRKGDLLFNLHRAAPAARAARRLIIVEGQFDVIALDQAGIGEATPRWAPR
jgi:DNA primase